MYLLEIDHKLNRFHLILSDCFDEPQAKLLLEETRERIGETQNGFHALCDLTTLSDFDAAAKTHFRDMMDLLNKNGARKIIRVIPNPLDNFGLTVMSYFHYDDDVRVITCPSLTEALTHL